MNRGRKLLFDASLVFIMGLLASGLGYLIRIILSRRLTLEEYGLFWGIFSFVSFISIFSDFGLRQSLTKFIPEFMVRKEYGKIKKSIKFVFVVNIVTSLVIALTLYLMSDFLVENYFKNEMAKPVLLILLGYFVFEGLFILLGYVFLGLQNSKIYSLRLFFINFFVLIGLIIFSDFDFLSPSISYLFSVIVGFFLFLFLFFKKYNFFKYSDNNNNDSNNNYLKRRLLNYGFPLLLSSLGYIVIGKIDILMLIYFKSLAEVGIYETVLPTAIILVTIGSSLATVILPFVSEQWSKGNKEHLKELMFNIYQKAFLIIIHVSLIVFFFSTSILQILFGREFIIGDLALKILIIGTIFFSLAVINNNVLAAIGKPKIVTKIISLVMVINIILNLFLIPIFGIVGAAITTSISYLITLVLSIVELKKYLFIKIPFINWIKIVFASGLMMVVMFLVKNSLNFNIFLEIPIILLIGVIIYLLSIKLLKLDICLLSFKK